MEKLKQNYDRVILIVIGLVTLVASLMLIMKSFAIGEKFQDVEEGGGDELPETPVEKVVAASEHVGTDKKWVTPIADDSEKLFRLFASIPIVNKDGAPKPIDLFDESTPVREGISNKYIMEHRLPYRRDDMAGLDLDGDGFTILEEYTLGGTDPRDKNDFPDATHKLQLAEISKEDYVVMFASAAGGSFSVRRMDPPGKRLERDQKWSVWVDLNATFPDKTTEANRFKSLKFEEKDVHNAATSQNRTNVGVLTVEDSATQEKIELIQRGRTNIPIYRASFIYGGPGGDAEVAGKEFEKGDTFTLNGTIKVEITKVTAEQVDFTATDGEGNPKSHSRNLSEAVKVPAPAAPEAGAGTPEAGADAALTPPADPSTPEDETNPNEPE